MSKKSVKKTEEQLRVEYLEKIDEFMDVVSQFIKSIPDEIYHLKSYAAERIACEAVNWGSYNHYEALGIFQEALMSYRETSKKILDEELEQEQNEESFTQMIQSIDPKKIAQA